MTPFKVDSHMHTSVSWDGGVHPADVVRIARQRGLDRICITDHNTIQGAEVAHQIDPELVIVGEEIMTNQGCEVLAFFVKEEVPPKLSPAETVARLVDQGAVISLSHPFDPFRNKPWSIQTIEQLLPHLDALEGFNARMVHSRYNRQAQMAAQVYNLPVTAGSDAHSGVEIGAAYLEMVPFSTPDEFRANLPQAIIRGQLSPAYVKFLSTVNMWRSRWGLKPPLHR